MNKRMNLVDYIIHLVMSIVAFCTLYPFINVVATSLSTYEEVLLHPAMMIPRKITFETYKHVISNPLMHSSYLNTIIVTVASTAIGIVITLLTAYPLSEKMLKGKKAITLILLFTMMFSGGLIPMYILISNLNMYNTLWALIIPGCTSAYYIFLMISFLREIPDSLKEAARMDGANEPWILFRVIVPLAKPAIACICLFIAVAKWNSFFGAMIYIKDRSKWTLQLLLREILIAGNSNALGADVNIYDIDDMIADTNIKTANIIITMLPIMCLYPFLQRYFVKGIMIGSVKG